MDLYAVLGLEHGASTTEIKRAYRRLARRHHPDINPGDREAAARFRQISYAYETLTDPERRRKYDLSGRTSEESHEPSFGFEGFDFSIHGTTAASESTFGDLFADVFRREGTAGGRADDHRGSDLHVTVALGFTEALRGKERQLTVTRRVRCHTCGGAGLLRVDEARCPHCHGAGVIRSTRGHMVFAKSCLVCGGSGRQRDRACPTCAGQGLEARTESLTVRLPAGVTDGSRIRIAGKGNAGPRGGETGDLYLTTQVAPHPLLRREGDDLHVTLPVAIHEAALGAKIEVPTIDGPAKLRVPPGTQSGQRFRLRERGAPSLRDGRRGDLVVEVRLVLPRLLDERSKELLREFGRINQDDVRMQLRAPAAD